MNANIRIFIFVFVSVLFVPFFDYTKHSGIRFDDVTSELVRHLCNK